jgi:membrane protease YdiL (CAAX protease family)
MEPEQDGPEPLADQAPSVGRRRSLHHRIFTGRHGIRSGWRLLLFVILAGVGLVALHLAAGLVPGLKPFLRYKEGEPFDPRTLLAMEVMSVAALLLAGWLMSRLERRPFAHYGLPSAGAFGRRFWEGLLWGLGFVSALYALLALEGGFAAHGLAVSGAALAGWGSLWAVAAVLVGVSEEFAFRGYAQFTLGQGFGFWPAAAVISGLFGLSHLGNPGEGWPGALSAAVFGLFFCLTLRRTGSLWFAVGMHAAFDFGETFLFAGSTGLLATRGHLLDAAVSGPAWLTGGSVGPESGINGLILFPFLFLVFHMLHRRRAVEPGSPPQASS